MDTNEIFQKSEQQSCGSVHLSFTNRQKNLFEQLDKAGEKTKNNVLPNEEPMDVVEVLPTNKRKRSEMKQFRGKESIFKRPELPLSKCLPLRSAPDFQRNPHKWMKYSLDDVRYEDMSEQSNTSAAMSFLRDLEERKSNELSETTDQDNSKIVFTKRIPPPQFNKSVMIKTKDNDDEKLVFKGSKVVMPEYVVGQKAKSSKKNKILKDKANAKVKEIKLDHLDEEEED